LGVAALRFTVHELASHASTQNDRRAPMTPTARLLALPVLTIVALTTLAAAPLPNMPARTAFGADLKGMGAW
jgi:hypothetical protein